MKLEYFEQLLKNNNAIRFNDEYILFNDLELYSFYTRESVMFDTFDELLKYEINGENIAQLITKTEEFYNYIDGGRGATGPTNMGGGFGHAQDGRGKDGKLSKLKFPAEFNVGGKKRSYEKTLSLFRSKYADADHEYGITVDENGFVHRHIEGGTSSVAISGNKNQMVIHNHPGGGNFSDTDLISVSSTHEKGIVAVGTKGTYTFTKTKGFKNKEFIKAVKNAKWPSNLNYDKGADWWLKKNASKYGYKYSFVS